MCINEAANVQTTFEKPDPEPPAKRGQVCTCLPLVPMITVPLRWYLTDEEPMRGRTSSEPVQGPLATLRRDLG